MQTGILITNGGPHPADKWAEATAQMIVSIAEHVAGEKRDAAVKLQAAVIDILERHHDQVQAGERLFIGNDSSRCVHGVDPKEHTDVDTAVASIIAAATGTAWEADFQTDQMKSGLYDLLNSHFATSMVIERSWYADRNPTCPHGQAFKASMNVGGK